MLHYLLPLLFFTIVYPCYDAIFHTIFGLIFMHALLKKPLDTTRHERLCRTQLQACLKLPIRTCLLALSCNLKDQIQFKILIKFQISTEVYLTQEPLGLDITIYHEFFCGSIPSWVTGNIIAMYRKSGLQRHPGCTEVRNLEISKLGELLCECE